MFGLFIFQKPNSHEIYKLHIASKCWKAYEIKYDWDQYIDKPKTISIDKWPFDQEQKGRWSPPWTGLA